MLRGIQCNESEPLAAVRGIRYSIDKGGGPGRAGVLHRACAGMLEGMRSESSTEAPILVLDTCAERGSVALFRGDEQLSEGVLEERTASTALLGAIRAALAADGLRMADLAAVGVVSGPGSFTGVRVGLAVAKGLCEAASLPLAAVSRLAVLAEAAGLQNGFAILSAGREQVYGCEFLPKQAAREWMVHLTQLMPSLRGQRVAVAEPALAERLAEVTSEVRLINLSAKHAYPAVRRCLRAGGSDTAQADANYVRNEEAIYQKAVPGKAVPQTGAGAALEAVSGDGCAMADGSERKESHVR